MNFRAIQVMSQAVSTLMDEIAWDTYGPQELHTPVVTEEKDCHNLDLLLDIMGSLTRMMDTRITYVTTEGKIVREWIQSILDIAGRYRRELAILESLEKRVEQRLEENG